MKIASDHFEKIETACKAFGCVPYFAIVVDAGDTIRVFILPMQRVLEQAAKRKLLGFAL